jgi:serpin B
VDAILEGVNYQEVALAMPKFEVESDFSLADMLTAMGMPVAFSTDADFSGMDGSRDLYIMDVVHKAFVSVDEAGTEAAAATAVVVARMGLAQEAPIEMTVDHPFVFLIRDLETNTILFLGRVLDPRA